MAIDWAGHGIAPRKHAAVDRTITECDDDLRIGRGFIGVFQGMFHILGYRSGDHQRVSMTRGGGNVDPEPLNVIERIRKFLTL